MTPSGSSDSNPTRILLNHVKELGALVKRMDPGSAHERVSARYREAKEALEAEERKASGE